MSRVVARRADVVLRRVAGDVLLVPLRGNLADLQRLFVLNPVAEFVWERLDGRRELGAIRDEMVEQFCVEPHVADADLDMFVQELFDAGLAQPVSNESR